MAFFERPPVMQRRQHLPRQVPIDAYGGAPGFRFAEMAHPGSILALPSGIYGWAMDNAAAIDAAAIASILAEAAAIDVLIIGTGINVIMLRPDLRAMLKEHGIGAEAMATNAAVRTYNILLAEGRPVAAALIAP